MKKRVESELVIEVPTPEEANAIWKRIGESIATGFDPYYPEMDSADEDDPDEEL